MTRSLSLLLIGALAGCALALFYLGSLQNTVSGLSAIDLRDEPGTSPAGALFVDSAPEFESERLAIYTRAASATSRAELESMIEAAAAESRSRLREVALEALLARLAEVDPARAARLGEFLELEPRLLANLYRGWATSDLPAALLEVGAVQAPARRQAFALALLDGLGSDAEGLAIVADALPPDTRFAFRIEALLARADRDPAGALAAALESRDSRARQLLIPALAARLAQADPAAALARGDSIADEFQRQTYTRAVLEAWAEGSPDTLFVYLETAPTEILGEYSFIDALARGAPERMLEFADRLPAGVRLDVQIAALSARSVATAARIMPM